MSEQVPPEPTSLGVRVRHQDLNSCRIYLPICAGLNIRYAQRIVDADVIAAGKPADAPPPSAASSDGPKGSTQPKPLARIPEAPMLPNFERWGPIERQRMTQLRRVIAERMTLSAALIPHVTHFDRADITELHSLIQRYREAASVRGAILTLSSFLVRASALALKRHPHFNASVDPNTAELIVKRYIHLGFATATERGLIVPVIRDADRKSVTAIARELVPLARRLKAGERIPADSMLGGSFTVTNLGSIRGTGAIPIINYPEVAILGASRAQEEPMVRGGAIAARLMLPLSLTFDHRVADGAEAARLVVDIVELLEDPRHFASEIDDEK